jgi:hypothetical protein
LSFVSNLNNVRVYALNVEKRGLRFKLRPGGLHKVDISVSRLKRPYLIASAEYNPYRFLAVSAERSEKLIFEYR